MLRSLVGSEMCIRDSPRATPAAAGPRPGQTLQELLRRARELRGD